MIIAICQCDVETATGVYSCLSVDMQFKREISYYVVTIYVPTCMLVIVSWFSFWIDPKVSGCFKGQRGCHLQAV